MTLEAELTVFININSESVDSPRVLQDAVKGFIRNIIISFASNLKKVRKHRIEFLETESAVLEQGMLNNISPENIRKQRNLLDELSGLLRQEGEFIIHHTGRTTI